MRPVTRLLSAGVPLRSAAAIALAGALCGCGLFAPQQVQPPQPQGNVWIDIPNRSDRSLHIDMEGQSENGGSAWATIVEGCEAFRTGGTMERRWRLLVDGEVVLDTEDLPGGVPGGGERDVLVTLNVAPDGDVSVTGPVLGGGMPPQGDPQRVPGCGEGQ